MTVRVRLLDAAHAVIESTGWSTVTMAAVAEAAGVSRQTVYNEFGTKRGLAEQLALRELDRFLGVVRERMAAADDLLDGIRSACEGALEMGRRSVLVRTVVGSLPGEHDTDLLQILTTESGEIVEAAVLVVRQSIEELFAPTPFTSDELEVAVESVVRLVLSALTRPSKPPAEAADDIAWLVGLALRGAAARG
ncbi:TetR family transcriptional regulator [Aeromicrobium sp. SMF47]|uniref:TetR family transcriptional regulator n=1 Tax=Aeromicrobium yanjiei TaxID=2662028 RepID=A0A5Q2MPA6_9ACTN|nr:MULTISPECIES: TetR family transcriptional regulator [Aeromicrobium]MRJ76434.1 TetR family transcriptional regulator [Aeromicrobium yanjiei]MRK00785.1 TetR family transcriptional regulator [Aeromicrobium sp. S22]QGG42395.1 TetR family transcriptional regulator [Aeromicrobium yanjiei]